MGESDSDVDIPFELEPLITTKTHSTIVRE